MNRQSLFLFIYLQNGLIVSKVTLEKFSITGTQINLI